MRGTVVDSHATGPYSGSRESTGGRQYLDMNSLQDMVGSLNLDDKIPVRL